MLSIPPFSFVAVHTVIYALPALYSWLSVYSIWYIYMCWYHCVAIGGWGTCSCVKGTTGYLVAAAWCCYHVSCIEQIFHLTAPPPPPRIAYTSVIYRRKSLTAYPAPSSLTVHWAKKAHWATRSWVWRLTTSGTSWDIRSRFPIKRYRKKKKKLAGFHRAKTELGLTGPDRAEWNRPDASRTDSNQNQTDSNRIKRIQIGPKSTNSTVTGPSQTESNRTEPNRTEPILNHSNLTRPNHTESNRIKPDRREETTYMTMLNSRGWRNISRLIFMKAPVLRK